MPCQSSQRKVVKHDIFVCIIYIMYLATPLILPRGPDLWVHLYTTRCADQLNVVITEMFVFRLRSYDQSFLVQTSQLSKGRWPRN